MESPRRPHNKIIQSIPRSIHVLYPHTAHLDILSLLRNEEKWATLPTKWSLESAPLNVALPPWVGASWSNVENTWPKVHKQHLQPLYLVVTTAHEMSTFLILTDSYLFNRIAGKSVHAHAFAHEHLQSPVSYVGIDMLARTILKTMYCTISNWRLTTNRDQTQQDSGLGQNRTCLQHKTNLILSSSCQHPIGCRSWDGSRTVGCRPKIQARTTGP